MVMRYYGVDVQQWTQANHALDRTDCPANPSACNSTGWPDFDNCVVVGQRRRSHAGVLYGYLDGETDDWVKVHDPLPCCSGVGDTSWMLYSAYVSGSGYAHAGDIYHVRPR
jgi:hypothetical protein